jgi:hypothetical protein
MEFKDFKDFLNTANHNKKNKTSGIDTISYFIDWCNNNNYEELLLRLNSERQGGLGYNSIIDFTNKRVIITRKKILNRIFDMGFVAGLGPFPYMIMSEKKQQSKIKDSAKLQIEKILQEPNLERTISYNDILRIIIKKGSNSLIHNMFGSFITKYYLTIFTTNNKFEYILPMKKNGDFDKMSYWMKTLLPIPISFAD